MPGKVRWCSQKLIDTNPYLIQFNEIMVEDTNTNGAVRSSVKFRPSVWEIQWSPTKVHPVQLMGRNPVKLSNAMQRSIAHSMTAHVLRLSDLSLLLLFLPSYFHFMFPYFFFFLFFSLLLFFFFSCPTPLTCSLRTTTGKYVGVGRPPIQLTPRTQCQQ